MLSDIFVSYILDNSEAVLPMHTDPIEHIELRASTCASSAALVSFRLNHATESYAHCLTVHVR